MLEDEGVEDALLHGTRPVGWAVLSAWQATEECADGSGRGHAGIPACARIETDAPRDPFLRRLDLLDRLAGVDPDRSAPVVHDPAVDQNDPDAPPDRTSDVCSGGAETSAKRSAPVRICGPGPDRLLSRTTELTGGSS